MTMNFWAFADEPTFTIPPLERSGYPQFKLIDRNRSGSDQPFDDREQPRDSKCLSLRTLLVSYDKLGANFLHSIRAYIGIKMVLSY